MDIVRRAYLLTIKELPQDASLMAFHNAMTFNMVRWIKLRVYAKRDWPSELGEYPKELEKDVQG